MGIKFDIKTGQVFVRNFDQGVVETLGGYIDYAQGGSKRNYFIDVPATDPMKVPVIFNQPYQKMESHVYPLIRVTRDDPEPDLSRWHSIGAKQYRIPSGPITTVELANGDVVSGYENYEELVQAFPFNLFYTITCEAFYEHEAIPIVKKILSVYKPISKIDIIDSESSSRSYTVFNDNGFQNVGELTDIHDRMKSYQISIRIEGELDLSDPVINKATLQIVQNTERI